MSFYHHSSNTPPPGSTSGDATPTTSASADSSTFLGSSIYSAFGGLIRRLSSDPSGGNMAPGSSLSPRSHGEDGRAHWRDQTAGDGVDGVFNPQYRQRLQNGDKSHPGRSHGNPHRRRPVSPMQPPPLEPLVLHGFRDDTPASARLMTGSVAEEIRIMVPERLRIEEEWKLVYSLDQDGASLGTLYDKCARFRGRRGGFVLAVRDDDGGTFGAYLSEAPHPSPHYVGTGECFLWRASLVAALPPPPSADTTNLGRSTTISSPLVPASDAATASARCPPQLVPIYDTDLDTHSTAAYTLHADDRGHDDGSPRLFSSPASTAAATTRPPRPPSHTSPSSSPSPQPPQPPSYSPTVRFKAFPYSGVNEYYLYCEPHWLSVGGGDGKFGLWLDDSLEKGVSATCMTFGNEPLSDEGEKFGVLGVEVWVIGAKD